MRHRDLRPSAAFRQLAGLTSLLALSLLSCGREITGPGDGVRPRVVTGLSFLAAFPSEYASLESGAGSVVSFNRVLVVFRRLDGTVALARMVDFPANATEVPLPLSLTLANDAPAEGETFNLFLRYLNAAGDTVFAGGPVSVLAAPRKPNDPPPQPADVPLTYTGPGNEATSVAFAQDTITVLAGDPFAFTASATDAVGGTVASAPLVFSILDAAHATLAGPAAGAGTALAARGTARVRVALAAGGAADTSHLVVLPKFGSLQVLSGNAQTAPLGAALPDSITVRTLATDLQPIAGISVALAVTAGGGTLSADTLVSDALGLVRFAWTLGTGGTAQTVSASAAGATAITVTATGEAATEPTALVLESGGGQAAAPGLQLPDSITVRLVDISEVGVAGVPIAFTLVQGGSVSPDTVVTDAAGLASTAWTLASVAGAQALWAKAVGVAVDSLDVHANVGVGPIASTAVTPALDTLVSIGETTALTATSADVALNPVAGSYTWTSDSTAIATVNGSGVVTAVAPGATWIIAEESGGTRDSARIVVDQKLASVFVTPGTREIYLGAGFDFNANAVDGLGVPLVAQPTFAWATSNPSIASIDSATGVVGGVGLGSTQVQATALGITGVANLTVKTAILRIAVRRDSIGFVASDTFTIEALGRKRSYRAVAFDTLDAPMAGITFSFESSNPSVAILDSTGSATARASAAANGVTSIRATAQGVQGAASLTVAQRLASIALTPATASIGPSGVVLITARGRDPDGTFLASLSGVTFASDSPTVATIHPSTGLVTGVANGTTRITALKDTIGSDTATVTVGGAVDPVISFGRDTLSIGRSASVSIPIYLSKPHASPVTVALAVVDTFAYFTQASITIPSGSTSGNATLNGRSAGLTRIIASDGGGGGYAPDTANLAVQATVRFATTSYSIVATNGVSTQVQLTDPAPAGGTYITYEYGTPGRASVSPDPAFIPAGQLSVNVVITALAGGGTTITPVATGVSGQLTTVTTYPATLDIQPNTGRLGADQMQVNLYVQTPTNLTQAVGVTLTSTDTNVVQVPSGVVIPQGTYYAYFDVVSKGTGTAYIRATAPGFTPDSTLFTVTTPRIDLCCNGTRTTTDGPASISITSEDSVGTNHPRALPLVISLSSSDTTIARLSAPTTVIGAGQTSVSNVQYSPGGEIGTAWIHATAPGHGADSILITVNGPKLSFSFTTARVGLGQYIQNLYVQIPNNTVAARTVYLQNNLPGEASIPDSLVIPAGSYYAYFDVLGLGLSSDTARFIATTAGHEPDTAKFVVTAPHIVQNGGGTYDNFRPPVGISTSVRDAGGSQHPRIDSLTISYVSSDTTVVTVTPSAVVLPGSGAVSTAQVAFHGVGTATVIASAPGHGSDTISYTVQVPKLSFSTGGTFRIGRRQHTSETGFYVQVPNNVTDTLPVTITQSNGAVDSLTTLTPNIPATSYYQYFGLAGLEFGVDTLIASAPDYLPDTLVITVTSTRLEIGNLPTPRTTTSANSNFTMRIRDSLGTQHLSMDTIVVHVVSSEPTVLQSLQPSYRILPGTGSINGTVDFISPGTAFLTITDSLASGYASDTGNVVTVTGPSLTISNGATKLGMRQNSGPTTSYVYVPDNVVGSPLWVYLASSDANVASVPDSVQIPVGTYYAYFTVTAHDVVGTVQISATALGYSPAQVNQEVTAPRFTMSLTASVRTTQTRPVITVRAADADGTQHPVNENVVVTLGSSGPGVGYPDSTYVTILAGQGQSNAARFVPVSVGSIQVTAVDDRVESYKYGSASSNIAVTEPALSSWVSPLSIAPGQYSDEYVYVPDTRTSPLLVNIAHQSAATSTPDTVYINTSNSNRLFRLSALGVGVDTLTFSAAGHTTNKAPIVVALGRVDGIGGWPTTLSSDSVMVTLYTRAANTTPRNVSGATVFNLSVDNFLQFVSGGPASVPITSVTVPANAGSVSFWVKRVAAGTANVSITNANYTTYSPTVTVNAP